MDMESTSVKRGSWTGPPFITKRRHRRQEKLKSKKTKRLLPSRTRRETASFCYRQFIKNGIS